MKHRSIPARIAFIACTLTAALAALPVLGIPRALEAVARPPASSRPVQLDGDHFSAQQIVVKFREGTGIRAAGNGWVTTPAAGTGSDGPALAMVDREVAEANGVVGDIDGVQVLPMVSRKVEAQFGSPTARGPAPSTRQPADLGLFSYVVLPSPDAAAAQQLIDRLSVIPSVEQAYPQPIPRPADIPPLTAIDLRPSQDYLAPAPLGIDLAFAHRFTQSRGDGISIIDVENGWVLDHEDLPGPDAVFSWHGINSADVDDKNHGTAVAGEIWGRENGIGVDGIAPYARMGWSSVFGAQAFPNPVYFPAAAIANASADLGPGDVLLIELHMPDPFTGIAYPPNACNPTQLGFLPVEAFSAEYAAISAATAKGIVVVEAAGNGAMNLDGYPQFDRSVRDSGAIMVGASNGGSSRAPACFTNSGSRVDVFAWGGGVSTLGYGGVPFGVADLTLRANGGDSRQWYTRSFGGTSSASPIVAGAAAVIQSIRASHGLPKLTSTEMRGLLSSTGTPQNAGPTIGTQPDLRAALRATLPDAGSVHIYGIPSQTQPAQNVSGQLKVTNSGPLRWTAADHQARCNWAGSSVPVVVGQLVGALNVDETAYLPISTMTPTTAGAADLRCDLTAGAVIATHTVGTIVAGGGTYAAEITALALPSRMPFGIDGDLAEPRDGTITVRNTGTTPWTDPGVHLQIQPQPGVPISVTLPTSVAPGQQVTVSATFECIVAGKLTVTAQMALGSTRFGSSRTTSATCK